MPQWFQRAVLVASCLGSCFVSLSPSACAQQDAMTEIYGQGVHLYFAGDYHGAEARFNQVLGSGSEDPRVHYFLGLSRAMQGGGAMAGAADFEAGATAEATSRNAYQVGQALQRIQGSVRAEIEKARINARAVARQQQLLQQRARMDAGVAPVTPAPVNPAPITPDTTIPDGVNPNTVNPLNAAPNTNPVTPTTPVAPANIDPFGSEALRGDATTVDPNQPVTPDTSNPFGDDPSVPMTPGTEAPATAPDATDPFSTPPATDMTDPFGTGN